MPRRPGPRWPSPTRIPPRGRSPPEGSVPQLLRLRLTDVPGWHASIDGRPLPLARFSGIMLQARVPPGAHVIELHYWPETFSIGIVCAACGAAGLAIGVLVGWRRRRAPAAGAPTVDPDEGHVAQA